MKKVNRGDALNIPSRDWNSLVDMRNANGSGMVARSGAVAPVGMNAGWVWVKNTSGSNRNRFDCMALGDPVIAIETNAQQDVVFEATTATADQAPAILMEPIADGLVGRAAIYGLTLANVATASSVSMMCGSPDASGNNLKPSESGSVRFLKAASTSSAKLIPVLLHSTDVRFFIFTLTSAWTGTQANADLFDMDDNPLGINRVIRDKLSVFSILGVGARGYCVFQGGKYYAIQAPCP